MARPLTPRHKSPNQANSQPELAQKTGLPLQRIKRLIVDGLRRREDGTFHVEDALEMAEQRALRNPGYYGDSEAATSWRTRRDRAVALKLEHALAEKAKALVAVQDVKRIWAEQVRKITAKFAPLGALVAEACCNKGPLEIQATIDKLVIKMLNELAASED